ncbi:MAG: glycine zipper 2TM domain-containing protein [Alphaproteobacteria bacterium]|nr:glycine zipper 2TM domain-containing protein [Alphaproteobacteria bacterium]
MKKAILTGVLALCMATPALAGGRHHDDDYYYRHQYEHHHRYYRHDHDYYRHCKRDNGTSGAIVGAVGGGLVGNAVAGHHDKAVGTILGAAGGALIGRELDRGDIKCR